MAPGCCATAPRSVALAQCHRKPVAGQAQRDAHDRVRTRRGHGAELRGAVRKRFLRPTGIARIAPVIAGVAISATAIDKQCSLYPSSGEITLERARIVSQVLAFKTWIAEHRSEA